MVYYAGMYGNSVLLQHHGILGMKWGKQNGPPYPLDASDHSASEKKAGWRKSLSKSSNDSSKSSGAKNEDSPKERKKLTSKQKRNIAVTVAALAVIGGTSYYLYKTGKFSSVTKLGKDALDEVEGINSVISPKRLLKKETIDETLLHANPSGSNKNCVAVSAASFFRQRGFDVKAKDVQVDPEEFVRAVFKNSTTDSVKQVDADRWKSPFAAMKFLLRRFGNDGEGMLCIPLKDVNKSHEFNFRLREGKVLFFDSQKHRKAQDVFSYWSEIDFSEKARFVRLDNLFTGIDSIDWDAARKWLDF